MAYTQRGQIKSLPTKIFSAHWPGLLDVTCVSDPITNANQESAYKKFAVHTGLDLWVPGGPKILHGPKIRKPRLKIFWTENFFQTV